MLISITSNYTVNIFQRGTHQVYEIQLEKIIVIMLDNTMTDMVDCTEEPAASISDDDGSKRSIPPEKRENR